MPFIFYDFETTGLKPEWDQVIQYGAVATDDDLTVKKIRGKGYVNFRSKRLPHIVPSPLALLTTGVWGAKLDKHGDSEYEMMRKIYEFEQSHAPAIFIGYNTMEFDEKFHRHGYYKNMMPTYYTNTKGNIRVDLMRMVQAAAIYAPDALKPAIVNGKRSFKLGDVARANNIEFDDTKAHDALFDVRGTIEVAKILYNKAYHVWSQMMQNATKKDVSFFAQEEEVFALTSYNFGRSKTRLVCLAGHKENDETDMMLFDLTNEPDQYLEADNETLLEAMKKQPKVMVPMIANRQPMAFKLEHVPDLVALAGFDQGVLMAREDKFLELMSDRIKLMKELATSHQKLSVKDLYKKLSDVGLGHYVDYTGGQYRNAMASMEQYIQNWPSLSEDDKKLVLTREELRDRSRKIRTNDAFQERIGVVMEDIFPKGDLPPYVEERIHQKFISTPDEKLLEKFHDADSWKERYKILLKIEDDRLKELGLRVVYNHEPDLLNAKDQKRMQDWHKLRLRTTSVEGTMSPEYIEQMDKQWVSHQLTEGFSHDHRWLDLTGAFFEVALAKKAFEKFPEKQKKIASIERYLRKLIPDDFDMARAIGERLKFKESLLTHPNNVQRQTTKSRVYAKLEIVGQYAEKAFGLKREKRATKKKKMAPRPRMRRAPGL